MVEKITYEFKNNLSELEGLKKNLDRFCQKLSLKEKCRFEMHLAVEEHFTNIVSHGYIDGAEHIIRMTLSHRGKTIEIIIEDDGVPFNPLEIKPPNIKVPLEERKIGGLGIYLTKKCMNDVEYQRKKGKNILTLRKQI